MSVRTAALLSAAFAAMTALTACSHAAATRAAARKPQPRVTVTVTKTIIRYSRHPAHRGAATPSATPAPAVSLGCKVLRSGAGEEFNVATVGGGSYRGPVQVSFYDYAGSGHVFPPASVSGATPAGTWYPVPAADIGASAEPSGCSASAG